MVGEFLSLDVSLATLLNSRIAFKMGNDEKTSGLLNYSASSL